MVRIIIDCPCGIRLTDYQVSPDAPVAVLRGECEMRTDCPACGTHHRRPIPASAT